MSSVSGDTDGPSTVIIAGSNQLTNELIRRITSISISRVILLDQEIPSHVSKHDLDEQVFTVTDVGKRRSLVYKQYLTTNNPKLECEIASHVSQLTAEEWTLFKELNPVIINTSYEGDQRRQLHMASTVNFIPVIDLAVERDMFSVFVTVPHVTETFYSKSDVNIKNDYPQCVVKNFPVEIEHCCIWAVDHFNDIVRMKPKHVKSSREAVQLATNLFIKYFNHKAQQLIHTIPEDHATESGQSFWDTRKKPTPLELDFSDPHCEEFISTCAELMAKVSRVAFDLDREQIKAIVLEISIPQFVPKNEKQINTDESITRVVRKEIAIDDKIFERLQVDGSLLDETQLGYLTSATNLRAKMYSIEPVARENVREIVLDIVPCDPQAAKQAAEYALIELEKLLTNQKSQVKNYFGNMLDPKSEHVISEPGKTKTTTIGDQFTFTEWDQWTIDEPDPQLTLGQFLEKMKEMSNGFECTMVSLRGTTRSLYIDMIPTHAKRRKQTLRDLIGDEILNSSKHVIFDLFFQNGDDEELGPPLKYVFIQSDN